MGGRAGGGGGGEAVGWVVAVGMGRRIGWCGCWWAVCGVGCGRCVCACVRVCVRARVRVCVHVRVRACVRVHVCVRLSLSLSLCAHMRVRTCAWEREGWGRDRVCVSVCVWGVCWLVGWSVVCVRGGEWSGV